MASLVVDYSSEQYNKQIEDVNASFDSTEFMYETLSQRMEEAAIELSELLDWARFVKLATEECVVIKDLEKHAVEKVLRSWKSIVGIITLKKQQEKKHVDICACECDCA